MLNNLCYGFEIYLGLSRNRLDGLVACNMPTYNNCSYTSMMNAYAVARFHLKLCYSILITCCIQRALVLVSIWSAMTEIGPLCAIFERSTGSMIEAC